jgi:NADH dehydrogenase FAD-containing subunit
MEPIRWYFDRSGHSEATFVQASCNNIDVTKKIVYGVDIRGKEIEIDYDYLVVAVGAEPATFGIPGDLVSYDLLCYCTLFYITVCDRLCCVVLSLIIV